jgi:putative hydrolase of the HAD superfamily
LGVRAALFDLDGTLTPRRSSVRKFAEVFAADFAERLEPVETEALADSLVRIDQHGYNPRRALDLLEALTWREAPTPEELEDHWQARFPQAVMPQPGMHEALDALAARGLSLGLITNGGVDGQYAKIDRLGLRDRMQTIVISDAVGCKKPEPRIFELACEELSVDASECWFVGDHPENDVLGATRAGMTAVWIQTPGDGRIWPQGVPAPAHCVETLVEVEALIAAAMLR